MNPFSVVKILIAFLTLTLCGLAGADDEVQVGRYSTIQPLPTAEQKDLFLTVVSITFPSDVQTVGQAMNTVLDEYGFQLADPKSVDPEMQTMLELPLPKSHRELGPLTLKSMLETLAGPVWKVVQDPVRRLVGFELCRTEGAQP